MWSTMRMWLFLMIPMMCAAQIQNDEEALALRRIADFWQEGEYQIAKGQIEEYLKQFPESSYSDTLCAALGDLLLREKNYSNALKCYSRIASKEWITQVFLNRMQCLYHLEWYATLADECEFFLSENPTDKSAIQATYYLAISLYQQCLNASKNPELLEKLALRAHPHFTTLFQSELSAEVSHAFAHLCCILKDFSKASDIYLELADSDEKNRENLLFQAAMLQTEFDKEKASETFGLIAALGQARAQDAAFNRLVLNFDLGKFEELVRSKEEIYKELSPQKAGFARLFLGRSFIHLKKYSEAIAELKLFIEIEAPYEQIRVGLIHLLDAAQQINDLKSLDTALAKLGAQDPERPKALFARAILLKKDHQIEEAKKQLAELLFTFEEFPQQPQAAFELAHLEYQANAWESCYERSRFFVKNFPSHELISFAWRYFVSSSAQLAIQEAPQEALLKTRLTADLESLLKQPGLLSEAERCDWQFLLAKTYYELNKPEEALSTLDPLLNHTFAQEANARLLMALLQRKKSPEEFCRYAEDALSLKADLIAPAQIHIALFNAYLGRSKTDPKQIDQAAEHLYLALELKGDLQEENLNWLADYYYQRAEKEALSAQRAITLLSQSPSTETNVLKLAKLYSAQNRTVEQVALLEKNIESLVAEAQLLLAEGYTRIGKKEKALELFDRILADPSTARSAVNASASLQRTRLKKPFENDLSELAACLKNLVLQRSLANEPIHLEAALDYIDLQSKNDLEKRLSLLAKTKDEFESTADLLSKDYQEARKTLAQKDLIYRDYISFFDAEIYLYKSKLSTDSILQKELQAKAKDLLLQIKAHSANCPLASRVTDRLQQLNVDEPSF